MERQHLAGHSLARSQRSVIVHGGGPQAREVSHVNRTLICLITLMSLGDRFAIR
jgi:hypothetical protein